MEVAQNVLNEIAGLKIPHESSPVTGTVTVSIGIATEVPQKGREYSLLIGKADQCMYAAKQGGRNRVAAVPDDLGKDVKSNGELWPPQPGPEI